jgi:hypothetical protein
VLLITAAIVVVPVSISWLKDPHQGSADPVVRASAAMTGHVDGALAQRGHDTVHAGGQ